MKSRLAITALFLGVSAVACAPPSELSPKKTEIPKSTPHESKDNGSGVASKPSESSISIIAEAPPSCAEYRAVERTTCQLAPASNAEKSKDLALVALDAALSVDAPRDRNLRLSELENCAAFEPGFIAALRADLAPPECADGIVEPALTDPNLTLSLELSQLLRGYSIGARLLRAESAPPAPTPPFNHEQFESFLKDRIRPWYKAQSRTIYDLAAEGAKLSGYGKAITAVEAGLSDLHFVDGVRSVPLPAEMAQDVEVVEVYEQGLEDALEPRKSRGRDAILVGLLHFGQQGILRDPRLSRARAMLTRLFSGSRVDSLEGLLLPPLPKLSQATVIERLAARLPPFFAERLLTVEQVEAQAVLRALLERGLPPRLRQHIERKSYERAEIAQLYAQALIRLGCTYFRPSEFTRATIILGTKGALTGPAAKEARLVSAIAQALNGGPENAVELMLSGPMLPDSMGKIEELEKLAKGNDNIAGIAAYDAAYLMTIIPQKEPDPKHWDKAARTFDDAARKLEGDELKRRAKGRAEDARATAQQLRAGRVDSAGT